MQQRPFILITNDDGIHAPGIKHLCQAVSDFADVAIVAPQVEKSGCGLSITWAKPLRIHSFPWENSIPAWSVSGTPADCVKMALGVLLQRTPHLVISGINRGSNAGRTVLYSGTVGGIIEATFKGIPGIAFSFSDIEVPPLATTKSYIHSIIHHVLTHPLDHGAFLNVTFPYNFAEGTKGVKMAKQGKGYCVEAPEQRMHPEGLPYYWLGGKWGSFHEEADSDIALLSQGYITLVPIQVNQLTDHSSYEKHKGLIEQRFTKHPLPSAKLS